jgi:peroxiredoxin/predicted 2-oxoglutarate/Fe(II)-dependent dioxygenase YbiX
MPRRLLAVGEPAPWFTARNPLNAQYAFDSIAGRYVVLSFYGSVGAEAGRAMVQGFFDTASVFDERNAIFFGVSIDPNDERLGLIPTDRPGYQVFWDFDLAVSNQYGVVDPSEKPSPIYAPATYILDERLRVLFVLPLDNDPASHAARVIEVLRRQPPISPSAPAAIQAPILIVPRIFEPELCRTLIRYYDERGGKDSGFMRDVDGKTVGIYDYAHKRRRDQEIEDANLRATCMHRIHDRLIPEVHKAFQFKATRMERYIVACYEAETGGHFRAHRDNTSKATAHRRFAVSLILNTGEFEGGYVRFPEFGQQLYTAPAGGAVVFSCSLLHEATPVTKGKRYVFLPFLYDDAAARIRQENMQFLGDPGTPPG